MLAQICQLQSTASQTTKRALEFCYCCLYTGRVFWILFHFFLLETKAVSATAYDTLYNGFMNH